MSNIKRIIQNHPFPVTCSTCSKKSFVTISEAKCQHDLACECGEPFPMERLGFLAKRVESTMARRVHDSGYR